MNRSYLAEKKKDNELYFAAFKKEGASYSKGRETK